MKRTVHIYIDILVQWSQFRGNIYLITEKTNSYSSLKQILSFVHLWRESMFLETVLMLKAVKQVYIHPKFQNI